MKKYLLLIAVLAAITACSEGKGESEQAGTLTNATLVASMDTEQVKSVMTDYANFRPLVQAGINIYRVEYKTMLDGKDIDVSGLFVIPDGLSAQTPIIVYNHWTMQKDEAPSFCNDSQYYTDIGLCYSLAAIFRCVILIPDYIGHGISSDTMHPYVHAETLGQASLDIIRAYAGYTGMTAGAPPANNNVVILGYSEGGYSSVALHKKIQETAKDLNVVKTYAGAGPYDIENFVKEVMRQDMDLSANSISSYLWVLATYVEYSGYTREYAKMFSAADNEILKSNNYSLGYLAKYPINQNPQNLFHKDFMDDVLNDRDEEFGGILKDNSLAHFVPSDSLILFHSEADSWVYVSNTVNTYNNMKRENAPVRCEIIPAGENKDHAEAAIIFFRSVVMNMFITHTFGL